MKRKTAGTETVYQMEAADCGAASFCMICSYWGRYFPLSKMRIETGVSRDGCNAGNILRAAKRLGMECHGYRKETGDLKSLSMPCIIYWKNNHFMVLEGFRSGLAFVNDPAAGKRKLTEKEFAEGYSKVVLTFRPTEEFRKRGKTEKSAPALEELKRKYRPEIILCVFLGIFSAVPAVMASCFLKLVFDGYAVLLPAEKFVRTFAAASAAVLICAGFLCLRSIILRRIRKRILYPSAGRYMKKYFDLPVSFFERRYAGDIAGRPDCNDSCSLFLTGRSLERLLNVSAAAACLAVLFRFNVYLALIAAAGAAAGVTFSLLLNRASSGENGILAEESGELAGTVYAGLGIASTLKSCGAENIYYSKIMNYDRKRAERKKKADRIQNLSGVFLLSESVLTVALIALSGYRMAESGTVTAGTPGACVLVSAVFLAALFDAADFLGGIRDFKINAARAADIESAQEENIFGGLYGKPDAETDFSEKLSGKIECRSVRFGYNRLQDPLITDFSFTALPGSLTAFTGPSGCGKSTVLKILGGLYEPWFGDVLYDGMPAGEIPSEVLHAGISSVSRHGTLFSGTIRDNLTMWNPAIMEKDLVSAAKDACIHDVIMSRENGYDTVVSGEHPPFSGGQLQRLEIARALSVNPSVLILDEATGALDFATEKKILGNIRRRGCTCIMATQRKSVISECSQVFFMQEGKIMRKGNPEDAFGTE